MIKRIIKYLLFALSLFLFTDVHAGGWVPSKGKGFFQLGGYTIFRANKLFNAQGKVEPITTTSIYISSLYAEYGLGKKWSTVLYAPFLFRQTINNITYQPEGVIPNTPGDEGNFFGDIDLTLKYGLIQDKPTVLSVSLTLGIPTGVVNGGMSGLISSGDGEFNQLLMFEVGRSFNNLFAQAKLGFNHRTKGISEEIRYGAEVGYTLGNFLFIAALDGIQSLKNETGNGSMAMGGLFSNNISFITATPKVLFNISEHWGLMAAGTSVFYAERILAAPAWNFGVFFKP